MMYPTEKGDVCLVYLRCIPTVVQGAAERRMKREKSSAGSEGREGAAAALKNDAAAVLVRLQTGERQREAGEEGGRGPGSICGD